MLRNKKYSGKYIKDGESFPDVYPRIVSEEIFNLVRQKVDENHFGKHVNDVIYLLKSKIICGYCGQPIHSESGTARDGTVKRYYKCQGRKKRLNDCSKSMIRKEILEEIVVNSTMDAFSDSQLLSDVTDSILVAYKKQIEQNSVLNLLKNDEKETQKALNNLMFALEQGIITATTKQRIQDLENKLEVIKAKIAVESAKDKFVLTKNEIIKFIKNALKKSPQQMIKTIVDRIVLFDDKVDIYYRFTDRKFTHPIGDKDKTENDSFADDSASDKEKIPEGANLRGLSFYKSSYDCVISSHKLNQDREQQENDKPVHLDIELYFRL